MGYSKDELEKLTDEQKRELLAKLMKEKQATKVSFAGSCVHSIFEKQANDNPALTAIVCKDQKISYEELNKKANQLANYIEAQNLGSESTIGVYLDNSIDAVISVLGILKAGCSFMGIDINHPAAYLRSLPLKDELAALITTSEYANTFNDVSRQIILDQHGKEIATYETSAGKAQPGAQNLAYALYSSGRMIFVDHRTVGNRLEWLQNKFMLTAKDALLQLFAIDTDISIKELLWPLISGCSLVVADRHECGNSQYLENMISTHNITVMHVNSKVLTTLKACTATLPLRYVFSSGEKLQSGLVGACAQKITGDFYALYSRPEIAVEAACYLYKDDDGFELLPEGSPVNKSIYILDEAMQPVSYGVQGDIYIGGTSFPRIKDGTALYVKAPFGNEADEYLFATGDSGKRSKDGTLVVTGQKDRHVYFNGYIIDVNEIEKKLHANKKISDCVVLPRYSMDGEIVLTAYVVPKGTITNEQILEPLRELLPAYMLPGMIIQLCNIPYAVSGKVDSVKLFENTAIDGSVVEKWEDTVRALPGVDQVATIIQSELFPMPVKHLSEIIPDWKDKLSKKSENNNEHENAAKKTTVTGTGTPAIVQGEELVIPEGEQFVLQDVLIRAAEQYAAKGVTYYNHGDKEHFQNYKELRLEAEKILAGLRKAGVKPRDKVVFQLDKTEDFIALFWGCTLGGFVPISMSVAKSYKQVNADVNKLGNVCKMLDYPIIITTEHLQKDISNVPKLTGIGELKIETIENIRKSAPDSNYHPSDPSDVAIMLLTSGSTGVPKAVMQSHKAILSRTVATITMNKHSSNDISLNWMPIDHVGGIVMFHIRDTYLGAAQVHVPTEIILMRPLKWLDLIDHYKATMTWAPNFAYALINNNAEEIKTSTWDLRSMRFILNAGEAIVPKTTRTFMQLLAPHGLAETCMFPCWGMSETCSGVVFSDHFRVDSTSDDDSFVEVGLPVPGFAMRIVDAEGKILTGDTIGRLQVKGPSVTSGYFNNPEANKDCLLDDSWFNVGDLGRLRDGNLTITGRENDVIIINGINFYSHEIEEIVESVAGVEVTYTAACPVRIPGTETDNLAIFFNTKITDQDNVLQLLHEISNRVLQRIGIYPDFIIPVDQEMIPKTAIGKIQRSQLAKRFQTGEFDEITKRIDLLARNNNTLQDWFYKKSWKPKEILTKEAGLPGKHYLVFYDKAGLAGELAKKLLELNKTYTAITIGAHFAENNAMSYQLDPANETHVEMLLDELGSKNITDFDLLYACAYTDHVKEITAADELFARQKTGAFGIVAMIKALAKKNKKQRPTRCYIIASFLQPVEGSEAIAYEHGTIPGIIKSANQELPWLQCGYIDLEVGDVILNADSVINEMQAALVKEEVAYRQGKRYEPMLERIAVSAKEQKKTVFARDGFYVMSGGLGGIAINIAQFLLEKYHARLLLLGRSPLDASPERKQSFKSLHGLGGEVAYEAVDITNYESLRERIDSYKKKWDRDLCGVLHLAGDYHESTIAEETIEGMEKIFRPKLLGAWNLNALLKEKGAGNAEKLFISFSSVVSFFGGAMIGAYASANSFLDSFSYFQNANEAVNSYCINWTNWEETGMSKGYLMKDISIEKGYSFMSPEQGVNSFRAAIGNSEKQIFIGLDSSKKFIRSYLDSASYNMYSLHTILATKAGDIMPSLHAIQLDDRFGNKSTSKFSIIDQMPLLENGEIDKDALLNMQARSREANFDQRKPANEIEKQLVQVWKDLLEVQQVGVVDNFFALGGNSLLAIQLVARIRDKFSVTIAIQELFESPTIEGIAARIGNSLGLDLSSQFEPIAKVARDQDIELSFAQKRLWFFDKFEPGCPAYNIPVGIRFSGKLDVVALEKVFNAIIQRHESLRTEFIEKDGNPLQHIKDEYILTMPIEDMTNVPEAEWDAVQQQAITDEAVKPFDLRQLPLLRTKLLKFREDVHVFILIIHHIITDGWSMGVMVKEMNELYNAYVNGREPGLPDLKIQYADFTLWQNKWLNEEKYDTLLAYWKKELAGVPDLSLPTDFPRPSVQKYNGAKHFFSLPETVLLHIKEVCAKQNLTLFMLLFGAFSVLLAKYSGQHEFSLGTPVANRNHPDIEPIIGFFVNMLAIPIDTSANESFAKYLQKIHKKTLEAYEHQDMPFERLVDETITVRDLSRNNLFQVAFILQNMQIDDLGFSGLAAEVLPVTNNSSAFDMTMECIEKENKLFGSLEYSTDLFAKETVIQFTQSFVKLLESAIKNIHAPLAELELLTPEDKKKIVFDWNKTERDYSHLTVHELFEKQATLYPRNSALVQNETHYTYAEVNSMANQVARYLLDKGVQKENNIAVCMERRPELIITLIAILKAGCSYVPLDPDYPRERLELMMQETKISLLLCSVQYTDIFENQHVTMVMVEDLVAGLSGYSTDNLCLPASEDQLAYVMFTSGSTGKPKGIEIIHKNIVRLVANTNYLELHEETVFMHYAPISFDASTIEIWGPLLNGGRIVICPPGHLSLQELGDIIAGQKINTAWMTASLFHKMVDHSVDALRPLKQLLAGGDVLSVSHVNKILTGINDITMINGYGPTENTTFTCCHVMRSGEIIEGTVPIGKPIANTTVYILDENLKPVPVGVCGELFTGGDGVARGYIGNPELTDEKFIASPFKQGDRLYRTGDKVRYRHDGTIEFHGRMDFQVKIRGYRIELGEIETVLMEHESVNETVVVALDDNRGGKRLISYLVPNKNSSFSIESVKAYLKDKLPDYMVPQGFVEMDNLPLTANGKVNRKALPEPDLAQSDAEFVAPQNETETIVAEIWKELLHIEKVGVHANFFDLGGHSLLAIELHAKIQKALGKECKVVDLFRYPTIRSFTDYINMGNKAQQEEKAKASQDRVNKRKEALSRQTGKRK